MTLPIDAVLPSLLATLEAANAAVLQAPPGTGKTTRVPLALLNAAFLGNRKIVMLEPRRLAARSAARYMAALLGEEAGHTVGYRTRLDTRVSAATRIEVVTEGILSRLLQADEELQDYGVVIFDEFHERSLQADLGLALVRECQQVLREDLRVLVMSATLDAAPIARLLGDAPVLRCPGQMHPVEVRYSPPGRTPWLDHLAQVVRQAAAAESGSLLVFLPGEGEIKRLAERLDGGLPDDMQLAPLYGQLAGEAQDFAIAPPPAGVRKLVLATAIAETSLTIEGVRVVIDAGFLRAPEYDPGSAMTRLVTRRLAAANAEQRKGRAGRLGPGVCIRLWSEEENSRLAPFATPEIAQADLCDTVLELAQWGVSDPATMAWLDVPPASAWAQAVQLLQLLDALDAKCGITAHGRAMLKLGLTPRLAHMVLRGREKGLGELAADLAALLSERDLLPKGHGADLHDRLLLVQGEQAPGGVDRGRLKLVRESARRLYERGGGSRERGDSEAAGLLLALAFPDRVAQRRPGGPARYVLANGRGAFLPDEDRLAREPWLVVADLDGQAREAKIYLAATVRVSDLEDVLGGAIHREEFVSWDAVTQSVQAREQRVLGALVLEDRPLASASPERVRGVLVQAVREAGVGMLPWTDGLRQWQARVGRLHALEPEAWPDVSDTALADTFGEWAGPWLDGVTRFSHLAKFPLHEALTALLDWQQQQALDRELPTHLTVPTGSRIAIDYTADPSPVLAVKLQEMFGLMETPRLAGGRVPLTIHLLSPAQRPVAVTQDLASFWANAYGEVRKDLRGRYPKHPWPEDPFTAVAQRGVKHPRRG
ncbi:MAG: ATP-dependent helicase HrpB [Fluviicoccus sp.]|uniref:ATP-dependent helicase HrpB n=1 Tax=Fluviicoccus sp. TaxID=2003552 RepID=UPI00271CED3A|nr:ATP-dependent helicase HrpB [Fluviicoccus sp.]MDO8331962.1 ATP-dependent helicase HrpB [Fluviicoccus sp.]